MGQYYRPLLITQDGRVLTLSPHDFESFSKLTEHSWVSNPFVNAVYSLICESPKKVAWIGDYARDDYNPDEEAYARAMPLEEFKKYYEAVHGENSNGLSSKFFSKKDLEIFGYDTKRMYLANHDKQVYIDLEAYIHENTTSDGDWNGWCMNPLPLLTACGNGRGGGDYHGSRIGYENIGIWAFDSLEYTSHLPVGYSEVMFHFNEHKEAEAV
jgi:hypothetical protein